MVPAGTCRKLIPEIEVYKVSEKHSQSPQEFPSRVIPHLPTHQPICSETPFFPQTLFWGYQSSCAIPAQRLHIYHPISWLPIVNQLTFTYAHISRRRKRVLKKKSSNPETPPAQAENAAWPNSRPGAKARKKTCSSVAQPPKLILGS